MLFFLFVIRPPPQSPLFPYTTLFRSGFAAIVGALNDLAEPAAGLRGVNAVGVRGCALHVVYLPAGKMRAADGPLFTLTVRGQNERAFPCSHQYANLAHEKLLSLFFRLSFLPRSPIEIKSTSQRNQYAQATFAKMQAQQEQDQERAKDAASPQHSGRDGDLGSWRCGLRRSWNAGAHQILP